MATEKAQLDLMMQRAEHDRKVSSLVDKLRVQRRCLDIAKDGLSELDSEILELQHLCCELSQGLNLSDSRCSSHTSQRIFDPSQSHGDTGGEASSQGSRRSAAGTVLGSEGADTDSQKLYSAHMKIRKLETELTVSQERSERIAGLEDEMEAYTSMQDEKIRQMQCQICDLMNNLEAERQRNEVLAHKQTHLCSPIGVDIAQSSQWPFLLNDKLSVNDTDIQSASDMQTTSRGAQMSRALASPIQLMASERGFSPYNPIESRGKERIAEEERSEVARQGCKSGSVCQLASRFEARGVGNAGCGHHTSMAAALIEREITNSPRPRKLPVSAMDEGSSGQTLVQKAISLYGSKGQQPTANESNVKLVIAEMHKVPRQVDLLTCMRPSQSAPCAQPLVHRSPINWGRTGSLDNSSQISAALPSASGAVVGIEYKSQSLFKNDRWSETYE